MLPSVMRSQVLGGSLRRCLLGSLLAVGLACRPALAKTATVLHSFSGIPDGQFPRANVVVDSAGSVYGEAAFGGARDCPASSTCGTVFKVDPAGVFSVLVTFHGASNGATGYGDMTLVGDTLYGSAFGPTSVSNDNDGDLLFSVKTDGTDYTVLHRFSGPDGLNPLERPVVMASGVLYETTSSGGVHTCSDSSTGCGVLLQMNPDGSSATLHDFSGTPDGAYPGRIVVAADGTIIGATQFGGGSSGAGVIYSCNPATGAFKVLHSFGGLSVDGSGPHIGGIAPDGTIYGVTTNGSVAPEYYGTLFALTKSGSGYVYTTLWQFTGGRGGGFPTSGPLVVEDGQLLGTTGNSVYKYANGTLTTIESPGEAPYVPYAAYGTPGLSSAGTVFGTTTEGGSYAGGTVYSIAP